MPIGSVWGTGAPRLAWGLAGAFAHGVTQRSGLRGLHRSAHLAALAVAVLLACQLLLLRVGLYGGAALLFLLALVVMGRRLWPSRAPRRYRSTSDPKPTSRPAAAPKASPTLTKRARALLLALLVIATGCTQEEAAPPPVQEAEQQQAAQPEVPGLWNSLRPERTDASLSDEQRKEIARLESIGYASGTVVAPALKGVTRHDPARAWPGLNFFVSGHAPEALLIDMEGRVLHRWRRAFLEVWPDFPRAWPRPGAEFFRRAYLYKNGDILAIYEGMGLVKLDRNSAVLWANPLRAHHDLEVTADGDIYVLTRKGRVIPRVNPKRPVLEDFISVLDADGSEKRRVSILSSLERSEFRDLWDGTVGAFGDIFHTNTLELLDGSLAARDPAFAKGRVLTSLHTIDTIAVVDLDEERIVWAHRGDFMKQHDPKALANGHLLLFDNLGPGKRRSRVLEFDPATPERLAWHYTGSERHPFFSMNSGTAQRLPNGDTLITESDNGRAFEVTPGGEIVWEYYNPHRAGEQGELIATLFEMVRLPSDFPTDWVEAPRDARVAPEAP